MASSVCVGVVSGMRRIGHLYLWCRCWVRDCGDTACAQGVPLHQQPQPPYGQYPPPYPPPYVPPPRPSRWPFACLGCAGVAGLGLVLLLVAGMLAGPAEDKPTAQSAASQRSSQVKAKPTKRDPHAGQHLVVYTVDASTNKGLVTYMTPSGISQNSAAKLPWRKKIYMKTGSPLSISVQNSGSGKVICDIEVDGKTVKHSESNGPYAIALCAGFIKF